MSAPVGTVGLVSCNSHASGASAETPSNFHASVNGGYSYSRLTFGSDASDVAIDKVSVLYASDFILSPSVSLQLAAGGLLGGQLEAPGVSYRMGPGWIGSLNATFRLVEEKKIVPYLFLGISTSALGTSTQRDPDKTPTTVADSAASRGSYLGIDFRVSLTLGKTFANLVSPYIAARVFGGPVVWKVAGETRLGTDEYHFQPAVGLALFLPGHFDLSAEAQPYFERGFTAAIGWRN